MGRAHAGPGRAAHLVTLRWGSISSVVPIITAQRAFIFIYPLFWNAVIRFCWPTISSVTPLSPWASYSARGGKMALSILYALNRFLCNKIFEMILPQVPSEQVRYFFKSMQTPNKETILLWLSKWELTLYFHGGQCFSSAWPVGPLDPPTITNTQHKGKER